MKGSQPGPPRPVLILGAGVNGAAAARELVLNGVPVWMVDAYDVAFGATSKSSRLIHGGLRYLEYGDFRLVRESLQERARLERLAPQFVRPLRLYIPIRKRTGGLLASTMRFIGFGRFGFGRRLLARIAKRQTRGLWTVRIGLWLYDRLTPDSTAPPHTVHEVSRNAGPQVDPRQYHWLCAYSDGQMLYPERFVLALLDDARQAARERGLDFRVLTYCRAERSGGRVVIRRVQEASPPKSSGDEPARNEAAEIVAELQPSLIVNATGAWGDRTLKQLHMGNGPLFGGTKGSHFFTRHEGLRRALGDKAIYAEAADGRLVFILPANNGVMVGTTDERFDASPDQAVASQEELDYLLEMVHQVTPDLSLNRSDIDMHYCGVRPLPHSDAGAAAAIPRGHWIVENSEAECPVLTLVGGKLTTCRALGEEVCDQILDHLDYKRTLFTRDRIIPGGENYPPNATAVREKCQELARRFGRPVEQVEALWPLFGSRVERVLDEIRDEHNGCLHGTDFPRAVVGWMIAHEWATSLSDLVERRLLLVYHPELTRQCLQELAACLVEAGRLDESNLERAVADTVERLRHFYGKAVL